MKLILLRHGESVWNKENRFTGWTDVDLSENGVNEAINAGKILLNNNITFDVAFSSVLLRANKTLDLVLETMKVNVPIFYSYRLNERHYGALQGLNKDEMRKKYGEEQVHIWRRSYDVRPPMLDINDSRYPGNDPKYRDLSKSELPLTECLKDTLERVLPYYNENILPYLKDGKNVLIVAHGNSIRSIIKYIDNISDEDIMNIEIKTGIPYIYEFDNDLNIINREVLDK